MERPAGTPEATVRVRKLPRRKIPAWKVSRHLHTHINQSLGWIARARWIVIVQRRPTAFTINLLFPLSLFNVLALATFAIRVEELIDRTGFTLAVSTLTCVNYDLPPSATNAFEGQPQPLWAHRASTPVPRSTK